MKRKVGAFLIPSTLLAMMAFFGFLGCAITQKNDASVYFNDPQVIKLCRATISGNVRVIDELVAAGVDVNARGKGGMTPLLFSLVGTNKSGLRRLMAHGADPNLQRDDRESFIYYAAKADDPEFLRMALKNGGNPNLRGPRQKTPLFEAAVENNDNVEEQLKLLLEHGANLNALTNPRGANENAAMAAAGINQYESALYLLHRGIDPTHKNRWGYTIAYPLEENGIGYNPRSEGYDARTKVAQFLIDRGMKIDLKKPYEAPADWLEKSFEAIGEPVPDYLRR